ncbi:hypothetical protein VKS41_001431 [Umbelopsis sp. WA50703]
MKFISAALLSLAVGYVSAQGNAGVLFTSPLTGSVWTAGQSGIITWTVEDTSVTTISTIDLRQGPSTALQLVQNIAVNIPVSPAQYTWNIPATIAAGTDYAITMGVSPNISYSGTMTIQAATGAASGSASSNSSAPAQSSAPAATSAASSAASSAPATSAASSAASSSAASSAPAASSSAATSGANAVKAGVAGAGLVAGAVALLL